MEKGPATLEGAVVVRVEARKLPSVLSAIPLTTENLSGILASASQQQSQKKDLGLLTSRPVLTQQQQQQYGKKGQLSCP